MRSVQQLAQRFVFARDSVFALEHLTKRLYVVATPRSLFKRRHHLAIQRCKIQYGLQIFLRHLVQEMPSMRYQPRTRQIDQPYIVRLIVYDQFFDEMMDGGIPFGVILVGEIFIHKQGRTASGILGIQCALFDAHEKVGIHLCHLLRKQPLQQTDALLTAIETASCHTETAPLRIQMSLIKQMYAPGGLTPVFQQIVASVGHRVSYGIGSHVQTNIILTFCVFHIDTLPFLCYPNLVGSPLSIYTTSSNKIRSTRRRCRSHSV